eukprot:m.88978 g.88978  ORF g.88978 m.88978 type:complete len:140 (-) comp11691_c0_seq3:101-520(-)
MARMITGDTLKSTIIMAAEAHGAKWIHSQCSPTLLVKWTLAEAAVTRLGVAVPLISTVSEFPNSQSRALVHTTAATSYLAVSSTSSRAASVAPPPLWVILMSFEEGMVEVAAKGLPGTLARDHATSPDHEAGCRDNQRH